MQSDEQIIEGLQGEFMAVRDMWGPSNAKLASVALDYFRSLGWTAPDEWEEVQVHANANGTFGVYSDEQLDPDPVTVAFLNRRRSNIGIAGPPAENPTFLQVPNTEGVAEVSHVSGNLHRCQGCGTVDMWGPTWQWYGSYIDMEEGRVVKTCSESCRSNVTVKEAVAHLDKVPRR